MITLIHLIMTISATENYYMYVYFAHNDCSETGLLGGNLLVSQSERHLLDSGPRSSYATSRKVADSIPDGFTGFFNLRNPSSCGRNEYQESSWVRPVNPAAICEPTV
jgi:hypothetical protein